MLPPFDLSVPADARYRSTAPEAAAKYAELAGCAPAAANALRTDVDAAAAKMASSPLRDDAQNIALGFTTAESEVVVKMTCGSESATIRQPR
jgi:hypothetical protein